MPILQLGKVKEWFSPRSNHKSVVDHVLIPGSLAPEPKPTTGQHSLLAELSPCVHQKAINNIAQDMTHLEENSWFSE